MPRSFSAWLLPTFSLAAAGAALGQGQDEFSETLLRELNASPAFRALTPPGYRTVRVELEESILPGPLVWGPSPEPLGVIPRVVATIPLINCDFETTRIGEANIDHSHTESYSFATTRGSSLAVEVSVQASWPIVSVSGSVTGTVSSSATRNTSSGEVLTASGKISGPIPPRHYFEAQVMALERRVEGQPFHIDVELVGNARVTYAPVTRWVPAGQAPGSTLVRAGTEPLQSGKRRTLNICRWYKHPGKVVGGFCNYTYAGKEYRARSYEMLSAPAGTYEWVSRETFEKDFTEDQIADGESSAFIAGQENRDDRYQGQLLVCRARYKGGTHPGKVVINDCMIGYGGSEIQIGDYDVLTRRAGEDRQRLVPLADYLPSGLRRIRIEGEFEGGKALNLPLITGPLRPVTNLQCVDAPALAAISQDALLEPDNAVVTRRSLDGPETSGRATFATARAADTGTGASVPEPAPPIAGREYARIDLSDDTAVPTLVVNHRTLRATRPLMLGGDVLDVQRRLTRAGWPVRIDGFYGGYTARAVQRFQTAHGLPGTGVFDRRTRAVLLRAAE